MPTKSLHMMIQPSSILLESPFDFIHPHTGLSTLNAAQPLWRNVWSIHLHLIYIMTLGGSSLILSCAGCVANIGTGVLMGYKVFHFCDLTDPPKGL